MWCTFRGALRLRGETHSLESVPSLLTPGRPVTAVRFQEIINGRTYVIEVLPVDRQRWRAQLVRSAGRTTALMPFYGSTPDDAARQLSGWLAKTAPSKH